MVSTELTGPEIRLTLAAEAENVSLVRHAIAGLGEGLGLDTGRIDDLKTVVTEACTNVVQHAYGSRGGSMDVAAAVRDGMLEVRIRDFGGGIQPVADIERTSLRLGLPLIASLADSFEIRADPDSGTEVVVRIGIGEAAEEPRHGGQTAERAPVANRQVLLTVVPDSSAGPVVSRVVAAAAARADLAVDRLSEAAMLGDSLAGRAADAVSREHLDLVISETADGLELRVGPLEVGAGERLLDLPELGWSLGRLADAVETDQGPAGDVLVLRFARS